MFSYQKRLIFPVHIEQPNAGYADILSRYYGGKDGKFISFTRYMSQRPYFNTIGVRDLLGLIAAEELSHMELIGVAIKKLGGSENLTSSAFRIAWGNHAERSNAELAEIVRLDQKSELRNVKNIQRDLELIADRNLQRLLRFIVRRDELHAALLQKAAEMVAQEARAEQYADLIHDYKMSLRVVD